MTAHRTETEARADGFVRTGWGSRSAERCEDNAQSMRRVHEMHGGTSPDFEVVATDDGRGFRVMERSSR